MLLKIKKRNKYNIIFHVVYVLKTKKKKKLTYVIMLIMSCNILNLQKINEKKNFQQKLYTKGFVIIFNGHHLCTFYKYNDENASELEVWQHFLIFLLLFSDFFL